MGSVLEDMEDEACCAESSLQDRYQVSRALVRVVLDGPKTPGILDLCQDRRAKKNLESNEQLKQELSSVPDRYNYPQPDSPPLDFGLPDVEQLRKELPNLPDGFELRKAEQGVGFTFESQETVDRLYNGSWYEAMK